MTDEKSGIARDWYHQSFDELYPVVYAHRTVAAAEKEALFSIEKTGLTATDRVLDLCCGNGRHMAHLRACAGCVTGLDYSPHLLSNAQTLLGRDVSLVRGDMRALPFEGSFDVVMNYFTSMGYFENDDENLAVVRGVARSLKEGGHFFIDYMCREWVEGNLEPESFRRQEEYEIHETRWIDDAKHRINKTTRVLRDGQEVSHSGESVKLYAEDEFIDLLQLGGLAVEQCFGDYSGAALGAGNPRMIAIGRKAAG